MIIPDLSLHLMLCLSLAVLKQILVYNQEMYAMIEAGLRGGMTETACKKVEASNKYMGDDYDSSKESTYINFFLEANNLFGLSMIQKLQYRDLEWDDKITEEGIINYKNGSMGLSMIQKLQYRNLEWDDKITEGGIINYKNGSMG